MTGACALDVTGAAPGGSGAGGATVSSGSTGSSTTSSAPASASGSVSSSTSGGAGGEGGGGGAGPTYAYRRSLAVQAQSAAIPGDYSVWVYLDHEPMVAGGEGRPDGDDLRIVHANYDTAQDGWVEVDYFRVIRATSEGPTTVLGPEEAGAFPLP